MYSPHLIFFCSNKNRPQGSEVYNHAHSCYEIVYFNKANATLTMSENTYHLEDGTIYIVYPDTPHSEIHLNSGIVTFLGFECESFPRSVIKENIYNILHHENIRNIMNRIIKEAVEQKENYSELISHMLSEIILLLQRYTTNEAQQPKTLGYIYSYISEYYNQQIDFEQLAKASGYSLDHFRHIFTKKFGMSPKQFQTDMRLKKSAELLTDSPKSCTEIASLCGFSTSAQFSKMFSDKYGVTPKQFRHSIV